MFRKNKKKSNQNDHLSKSNSEALDFLARRIKHNINHLEYQFQISLDKNQELRKPAFTMYLTSLINLKDSLDYEILKYGGNQDLKDMKVYQSLEELIETCRMLVTNNSFELEETVFHLKILQCQRITVQQIIDYIYHSLAEKRM